MLYLLDANVLIDANRDYYSLDRVPEFWEWLEYEGREGNVKIPIDVFEEIKVGDDELADWAKQKETESALLLKEDADPVKVSRVTNDGYAADLTDDEIEKLGRDPFLIAYALDHDRQRCVVTTEASKPKRQRANRHVPDLCDMFNIPCSHTFEFVRDLNFRTNWKELV